MTTEKETDIPDWLQIGAKVAVVNSYGGTSVTLWTVERFTPTRVYITSASGRMTAWFPLSTLKKSVGDWGGTDTVRPLDDPEVVRLLAEQRLGNAYYKVEQAKKAIAFIGRQDNIEQVHALKEAAILLASACNKYFDAMSALEAK